jgi:hypothetical protein
MDCLLIRRMDAFAESPPNEAWAVSLAVWIEELKAASGCPDRGSRVAQRRAGHSRGSVFCVVLFGIGPARGRKPYR